MSFKESTESDVLATQITSEIGKLNMEVNRTSINSEEFNDFKKIMELDHGIFINFEEFGEYHTVDGKEMLVIVDDNEYKQRTQREESRVDGVYTKHMLFYVKAEDIGGTPAVGRILKFDKKDYMVKEVTNEDGIYSITLEANAS